MSLRPIKSNSTLALRFSRRCPQTSQPCSVRRLTAHLRRQSRAFRRRMAAQGRLSPSPAQILQVPRWFGSTALTLRSSCGRIPKSPQSFPLKQPAGRFPLLPPVARQLARRISPLSPIGPPSRRRLTCAGSSINFNCFLD